MKKVIYITFFLFLNSFGAKAQQYIPFPENNALWTVQYESESCNGNYSEYQYQITGDTTINNLTYHKLRAFGDFICGWPLIYGAFRNDTINKKVYFLHSDSITESIFYDFNLVQGDTIKGYLEEISNTVLGYNNVCIIDSVDSVLINGAYRNRWNYHSVSSLYDFNNSNNPSYIEGVGNTFGLFEGLQNFINLRTELICHSKNGTLLFGTSQCAPLNIDTYDEYTPLIYPNPSGGIFKIELKNSEILSVEVYNVSGQLVLKKEALGNQQVDINNQSTGLYFLKIITENEAITTQIINR